MLNPLPLNHQRTRCISSPIIPSFKQEEKEQEQNVCMLGKARSRFSEYEDNIIRQGVANRLTWGQISDLLPHRKRATCFNRYRTLQGIRKSRKSSASPIPSYYNSPPSSPQHEYNYYQKRLSSDSSSSSDVSSTPTTPTYINDSFTSSWQYTIH